MSMPGMTLLFLFVVLPLLLGFIWSFTNMRLISPVPTRFVGWENYRRIFGLKAMRLDESLIDPTNGIMVEQWIRTTLRNNPDYQGFSEWFRFHPPGDSRQNLVIMVARDVSFMKSLVNTLVFVLVIVPCQGGLALVLAVLVNNKNLKGKNAFRTIFFAPVATSMAVVAIVWVFLYNPQQGMINSFLSNISGGRIGPVNWLIDTNTAMLSLIIVSIWQSAGFQMVIFLAGLQQIPEYLYESARIDGASSTQQFWTITFPLLRNTTVFVIISTTILAFRVFTQVDVMTKGGPLEATSSIVYYIVQQGFRQQHIGYASAITMVFFIFVLCIAGIQKVLLRSDVEK